MEIVKTIGTCYMFESEQQKQKLLELLGSWATLVNKNVLSIKNATLTNEQTRSYEITLENGETLQFSYYNHVVNDFIHGKQYVPVLKSIKKQVTKQMKNYELAGVVEI